MGLSMELQRTGKINSSYESHKYRIKELEDMDLRFNIAIRTLNENNIGPANANFLKTVFYSDTDCEKNMKPFMLNSKGEFKHSLLQDEIFWKKCDGIHNWFVKNVQKGNDDCKNYFVTLNQITKLRDICKMVLEDHGIIDEKFPYSNENPFDELTFTMNSINNLLKTFNPKTESLVYSSSW